MKVTIELDPETLRKAAAAADNPASSKSADEVPAKAESPAPTKQTATKQGATDKASTPRASEKPQPEKGEEKPSPRPPAVSSPSGNFANQGGISNVVDPDRNKPGVYRFSYTEEKR